KRTAVHRRRRSRHASLCRTHARTFQCTLSKILQASRRVAYPNSLDTVPWHESLFVCPRNMRSCQTYFYMPLRCNLLTVGLFFHVGLRNVLQGICEFLQRVEVGVATVEDAKSRAVLLQTGSALSFNNFDALRES